MQKKTLSKFLGGSLRSLWTLWDEIVLDLFRKLQRKILLRVVSITWKEKQDDKVFGSENVAAFIYRSLFYSWINGFGVQLFLETLGKSLLGSITENHKNCCPGLLFVCVL